MTTIQLYGPPRPHPGATDHGDQQAHDVQLDGAGALTNVGHRPMTTDTEPVPLFERFTVTYQSGTVIPSFYPGGATLREAQVSHPLATVAAVEDSRVSVEAVRT